MKLAFVFAGVVVFAVGIVLFFAESPWGLPLGLIGSSLISLAVREYVRERRAKSAEK